MAIEINFIQQAKRRNPFRKTNSRGLLLSALLMGIGLTIHSCIDPFSPPEVNNPDTFLVVDGFLNVNGDTSTIRLSHTQNTNDNKPVVNEPGASITVEAENGETYLFQEVGNGLYQLPPAGFDQNKKYRLHIKRRNGGNYESEYVVVSKTPPIDSLTYRVDANRNAMLVYVNAHDASNATRFYRWNFDETYEYRMPFYSSLTRDVPNKQIIPRPENINVCWRTLSSKDIKLGSTIKLSQDIIRDVPVNIIDIGTNKLYFGYTILVRQYGLTREAFEYWTDLAKTTQGTGSLFDPQPSQVTGNIRNKADEKELVFGYFSAAQEQKKRIFIKEGLGAYPRCQAPDTLTFKDALEGSGVLLSFYMGLPKSGYLSTSESCADCRSQGGTTTKPSFWE
nr:DUF4249 domain-containing protein [uncultured Dyadobacter sp.]